MITCDMCELARNSVTMSGFDPEVGKLDTLWVIFTQNMVDINLVNFSQSSDDKLWPRAWSESSQATHSH